MNGMNRHPSHLPPPGPPHNVFGHMQPAPLHPPMGMEMAMLPPGPPIVMMTGQPAPTFAPTTIFRPGVPQEGPPLTPQRPPPLPHMPPPVPPIPGHLPHPPLPPPHPPPSLHAAHMQHHCIHSPMHNLTTISTNIHPHSIPPPPSHLPPHPPLPAHPPIHISNSNPVVPVFPQDERLGEQPPLPPSPGNNDLQRPPLPSSENAIHPPLPPLPPLPPPTSASTRPPPPRGPPPANYLKMVFPPPSPPRKTQPSKSEPNRDICKNKKVKEHKIHTPQGQPITSIVSSRPSKFHQYSLNGIPNRTSQLKSQTNITIAAPTTSAPSFHVHDKLPQMQKMRAFAVAETEDEYDPAGAMFSPASSPDNSTDDSQEETLIKKYVINPKAKSAESLPSLLKTPDSVKSEKKKRVSFFNDIPGEKKPPPESPARPNLDARLKIMFGGVHSPQPVKNAPQNVENPSEIDEVDDPDAPLSPTPSPFVSRNMYLHWHRETVNLRKASNLSRLDFVDASGKKTIVEEQVVNGVKGMPPLPKNLLPTVPPPNYKKTEITTMKDDNSKVECKMKKYHKLNEDRLKADSSIKNNIRVHPYKNEGRNNPVKTNSLDSELELTCESTNVLKLNTVDKETGIPSIDDKTVGLVMKRVIEELKRSLKNELTKELVDKRVKKCLKRK